MQIRTLVSRLGALTAAAAAALAVATPSAYADSRFDSGAVDEFLQAQLTRHGIPGMAVGLVQGDQTIHVSGFGTTGAGGQPVGGQTPFVLASASKPLTATAVMQLVDAGKVALDLPVQRYLPQFQLADRDAAARITVRQLLTHTSGLPVSACEREVSSLDDFVRSLRTVKIDRPVGSRHVYCSGNYNILGLLVQQVSGQPFGQYVQQHVFQPLDMQHSYTSDVPARQDGLGVGHRWIFGFNRPMDYYNASGLPAGYLISTAEDMTHFLIAQTNGGTYEGRRLLSSRALGQMQQPAVDAGEGSSYGLGWQQGQIGGVPLVYHFGGNYNMETVAMMDPRTHRAAVLLINTQGLLATGAFRSIEGGLARLLDGQPTGAAAMPVPTVYAIVDSILVALTALTLLPLFRMPRWAAATAQRAGQRRQKARVVVRIVAELAGGLLLLTATGLVAAQLGATWGELAMLIPDLLVWVWGISAVLILTALLRAVTAATSRVQRRNAPTVIT